MLVFAFSLCRYTHYWSWLPLKVCEEIGLETDEEYGVNYKTDFPLLT